MSNKRVRTAQILLLVFLCTLFTGYGVTAAPAATAAGEQRNLILNGGFEEKAPNGMPLSWTVVGGTFGQNTEISADAKTGESALHFHDDTASIYAFQKVVGLYGGEEYTLSFWMKLVSFQKTGAMVKLSFGYMDPQGNSQGISDEQKAFKELGNRWRQEKMTFTLPKNANTVTVLIRIVGGGEVYYDDVELIGKQDRAAVLASGLIEPSKDEMPAPADPVETRPPYKGAENIVKNGGFEELDSSGYPVGWAAYQGWEKGFASVETEKAIFGNNCLRVSTTSGGNPWAMFTTEVLEPGAEYELSFWAAASKGTNFVVKFEGYAQAGSNGENYTIADANTEMYAGTDWQWRQFTFPYVAPEVPATLKLYPRVRSDSGTCLFDEISFYKVDDRPRCNVETDWVFYYSDMEWGKATLTPNLQYYPELVKGLVDFALLDGENVLFESKNVGITDGKATFIYDLDLLTEKQKEYTVSVQLRNADGEIVTEKSLPIYKYDRPTMMTKEGDFIVDGKPFNPVFGYHARSRTFEKCAEAGVNLVQNGAYRTAEEYIKELDEMHKYGLKALVPLYGAMSPAGSDRNAAVTAEVVAAIKDHPAVFAYIIQDEPFLNNLWPQEDLRKSYKLIRDIDPVHPTFIVECFKEYYATTAKYCDVLCVDLYPGQKQEPCTYVQEGTSKAVDATKGEKPVFTLLQTFGSYRATENELRNMMYQVLLAGGRAMGYYTIGDAFTVDGKKYDLNDTELWNPILAFYQNEETLLYDYFLRGKYPTFNAYYGEDAWYRSFVKDGELYVIVLDRTKEDPVTVEVKLTSDDGSATIGAFTGSVYVGAPAQDISGNGNFTATLEPGAAVIYKLKPATMPTGAHGSEFLDLNSHLWARDAVEALDARGIVNKMSDRVYAPAQKITRGDFAMFLVRTLGLTADSTENFADVKADAPYAKELAIGKAAGIINGIGDNLYNPEAEISRQDMMTIIARALQLEEQAELDAYTDTGLIADYALTSVRAMVASGLIQGNADGTLNPRGTTTRAEAAVIMERILKR